MIALRELAEVSAGQSAPQNKNDFGCDGQPFIRAGSLDALLSGKSEDELERIPKESAARNRLRTFPGGTILFAKSGMSAAKDRVYVLKKPAYVVSHLAAILPKPDRLDSSFFRYWLRQFRPSRLIKDKGYPSISLEDIAEVRFPDIEIAQQRGVATVLEMAEKVVAKREEALRLLDKFLKATFLKMFGDPIINPKGWEIKKLDDLASNITNGTTPLGGENVYAKEGITFFRSQNVWNNKLEYADIAYIDENMHRGMRKSSLKHGDILMTKTGRFNTENSSLGRAAMFLGEDDSANINGHVYLIRLDERISKEFVLFILTTNAYRNYIRTVSVGGIDKRQINKSHLQEFPIILPPRNLQNKFVSIVNNIEKLKQKMKSSEAELQNLFNCLMQKAFKGELFNA